MNGKKAKYLRKLVAAANEQRLEDLRFNAQMITENKTERRSVSAKPYHYRCTKQLHKKLHRG